MMASDLRHSSEKLRNRVLGDEARNYENVPAVIKTAFERKPWLYGSSVRNKHSYSIKILVPSPFDFTGVVN